MNFKLIRGSGSPKKGACWMSAVHAITQLDYKATWTDQPECVSPVVRSLCIFLNDFLKDGEREAVIGPHLFAPVGTATGDEDEQRRGWLCMDYAVRRVAPIYALKYADRLRALKPVRDTYSAIEALKLCSMDSVRLRSVIIFQGAVMFSPPRLYSPMTCSVDYIACARRAVNHRDPETSSACRAQVIQVTLALILECCAIGERREVVRVRGVEELARLKA